MTSHFEGLLQKGAMCIFYGKLFGLYFINLSHIKQHITCHYKENMYIAPFYI